MRIKTTPASLEHAIELYLGGKGLDEASSVAKCGRNTLSATLAKRGLKRTAAQSRALAEGPRRQSYMDRIPLPIDDLVAAYGDGASILSLANAFGVSRTAVSRRLLDAGVSLRDMTASNRLMMERRSPAENRRNTLAAHQAVQANREEWIGKLRASHAGRGPGYDAICKAAITREKRQINVSPAETLLQVWLAQRGIEATPQKAVGPYNVDLTAHPVAVEVLGGGWHAHGDHRRRSAERLRYILDQGLVLILVWVNMHSAPLREAAADYVASYVDLARRDPSLIGQHRVIWGDGEEVSAGQGDVDDLAQVPPRRNRLHP